MCSVVKICAGKTMAVAANGATKALARRLLFNSPNTLKIQRHAGRKIERLPARY
jgi:hypothetical protein